MKMCSLVSLIRELEKEVESNGLDPPFPDKLAWICSGVLTLDPPTDVLMACMRVVYKTGYYYGKKDFVKTLTDKN